MMFKVILLTIVTILKLSSGINLNIKNATLFPQTCAQDLWTETFISSLKRENILHISLPSTFCNLSLSFSLKIIIKILIRAVDLWSAACFCCLKIFEMTRKHFFRASFMRHNVIKTCFAPSKKKKKNVSE